MIVMNWLSMVAKVWKSNGCAIV